MEDVRNDVANLMELESEVKPEIETKPAPEKPVVKDLAPGDVVSIAADAVYYKGQSIPDWVRNQKWIVHSLSGDRVVINKSENGKHSIMSPINRKYLISDAVQEAPVEEFVPYLGKVIVDVLNYRQGPGLNYKINGTVKKNEVYTIVAEDGDWGKLKSGAGWIYLDYIQKI
jgi:hypothetical protein